MTVSRSFESLRAHDRVLITGASGWLGRELLYRLRSNTPEIAVLPFGSRTSCVLLGKEEFDIIEWDYELAKKWNPSVLVHLAYATRDKVQELGETAFRKINMDLSARALSLMEIPTIRGVVMASSGVAEDPKNEAYAELKAHDETQFLRMATDLGVSLVIARAWSLTGAFCTKPRVFAFYELLRQSLYEPQVVITSTSPVFRRYMDAGEYLEICLSAAAAGVTETISSAGELVELSELAEKMLSVHHLSKPIIRCLLPGIEDAYYTHDLSIYRWAEHLGVALTSLDQQIRRSTSAIRMGERP